MSDKSLQTGWRIGRGILLSRCRIASIPRCREIFIAASEFILILIRDGAWLDSMDGWRFYFWEYPTNFLGTG